MKQPLAFALGGGGARGALQVGALRALLEAGYQPEVLAGTSIGAINAAYLALHGVTLAGIEGLIQAWDDASRADLLPQNYLWLTLRAIFRRPDAFTSNRLRDFILAHGLHAELRFGDLQGVRLVLVAADLNGGCTVVYGRDPEGSVLEGLLASTALPPWVGPIEREDQLLVDGGLVSNLPIQAALEAGAAEIIALDLSEPGDLSQEGLGFGPFLGRLLHTIDCRQAELEMALAEAHRVPVHAIRLRPEHSVPVWDFSHTQELIELGYRLAQAEVQVWQGETRPGIMGWLRRLL
jgi:NTE family protein